MPNEMPDLWPEDLVGGEQDFVTPATILKTAAAQLGKKTRQQVTAKVDTRVERNQIVHRFWVNVSSLEYRYELFELYHPVDSFYPLTTDQYVDGKRFEINSEEELKDYLKKVFASERTKNLVDTLLKQVRS